MIQATPPNISDAGDGGFFSRKMNALQMTEERVEPSGHNINTDLVNA